MKRFLRSAGHFAVMVFFLPSGCNDDGTTSGTGATQDAAADVPATTDVADAWADARETIDTDGAWPDAESGADGSDVVDGEWRPDGPSDDRADAVDVTFDVTFDVGDVGDHADSADDRGADDRAAEDHDATDGMTDAPLDRRADALVCPPLTVVAYNRAGCGDQTPPPYCQGPTDACLTPVCLCNGTTGGDGCGFSTKPFTAWGPCPDGAPGDVATGQ